MKSLPMENSSDAHRALDSSHLRALQHSSFRLAHPAGRHPYLSTLLQEFVYDDTVQILENPTNSEAQAAVRRLPSQTPAAKP